MIHPSLSSPPPSILALFARGRNIGYVFMQQGHLLRYGVKTIKGKRQGSTFHTRIARALLPLLEWSEPTGLLVIEQDEGRHAMGALSRALPQVLKHFTELVPMLVSLKQAKRVFCQDSAATHRELRERMQQRYPTLWTRLGGGSREKTNYWQTVLFAIALAELAQDQWERRHRKLSP